MSMFSKLTLSLSGAILSLSATLAITPLVSAQTAAAAKKEVAVRPEALKLVSFDIGQTKAVSVPPKTSQVIEFDPPYMGFSIYRAGKAQVELSDQIIAEFNKQKTRALAQNKSVSFPQGPELVAQVFFHNLYFCSGNNVPTCDYAILPPDQENPVQSKIVGSKTWADYNFTETVTLITKAGLSDGPSTFISETNLFLKAAYFLDVPNKLLTVYWKAMTTEEFTKELDDATAAAKTKPVPAKPIPLPKVPAKDTPAPVDPPGSSPKSPTTPKSPEPAPSPAPSGPEVPVTPPVTGPIPVSPQPGTPAAPSPAK